MSAGREPEPEGGYLSGAAGLRKRIEEFARPRRFRARALERWCRLAVPDAAALLEIAATLRLGENQWRDVLELAEETALRQGGGVAQVLASAPVRAALSRGRGRNDAVRALRAALRRLRFPQLVAAEVELANCIRALALPGPVRVVLPEYLQDDEVRIEVRGRDSATLRAAVESLATVLRTEQFERIFSLLRQVP